MKSFKHTVTAAVMGLSVLAMMPAASFAGNPVNPSGGAGSGGTPSGSGAFPVIFQDVYVTPPHDYRPGQETLYTVDAPESMPHNRGKDRMPYLVHPVKIQNLYYNKVSITDESNALQGKFCIVYKTLWRWGLSLFTLNSASAYKNVAISVA